MIKNINKICKLIYSVNYIVNKSCDYKTQGFDFFDKILLFPSCRNMSCFSIYKFCKLILNWFILCSFLWYQYDGSSCDQKLHNHIIYRRVIPMFAKHITQIISCSYPVLCKDFGCYCFPNSMISKYIMSLAQC